MVEAVLVYRHPRVKEAVSVYRHPLVKEAVSSERSPLVELVHRWEEGLVEVKEQSLLLELV